ncbi:flagellar hook-length control protein FliK [Sphingomonas sp.]|uniref:flagellar hook-length control protein FliK n=1 Tax=Sphingomonas sp. TaxID=28214 RepID=UPI003B00B348
MMDALGLGLAPALSAGSATPAANDAGGDAGTDFSALLGGIVVAPAAAGAAGAARAADASGMDGANALPALDPAIPGAAGDAELAPALAALCSLPAPADDASGVPTMATDDVNPRPASGPAVASAGASADEDDSSTPSTGRHRRRGDDDVASPFAPLAFIPVLPADAETASSAARQEKPKVAASTTAAALPIASEQPADLALSVGAGRPAALEQSVDLSLTPAEARAAIALAAADDDRTAAATAVAPDTSGEASIVAAGMSRPDTAASAQAAKAQEARAGEARVGEVPPGRETVTTVDMLSVRSTPARVAVTAATPVPLRPEPEATKMVAAAVVGGSGAERRGGKRGTAAVEAAPSPVTADVTGSAVAAPTLSASLASPASTMSAPDAASASTMTTAGTVLAASGADRRIEVARTAIWADGIARDIASASATSGTAHFTVSPQSLGQVTVAISRDGASADVAITAATADARALIADAQPQLVAEARSHGLDIRHTRFDVAPADAGNTSQTATQTPSGMVAGSLTDRGYAGGAGTGAGSGGAAGRQPQQPRPEPQQRAPVRTAAAATARPAEADLYA